MIHNFETYIIAQKNVAFGSIVLGLSMILLAILIFFIENNPLSQGLRVGLIVVGLLSLGGGISYKNFTENLFAKQKNIFQKNPNQFQHEEKQRMQKVVKTFPTYQVVFVAVIILSLIGILYFKNGMIQGILFSVVFLLLGNLIIEKFSKPSIDLYYQQLSNIK